MTGPILQRPEGITQKEIAAHMTTTKATGTIIVNAIALSIVVPSFVRQVLMVPLPSANIV